jgi:hypothetical protein
MRLTLLAAAALSVGIAMPAQAADAPPAPIALVICAPGFPGTTAEAQPTIDALVKAMAGAAKWGEKDLSGAYYETEKGGLTRLSQPDAALALVSVPFFLEHADELKLQARQAGVFKGKQQATETWTLFAKKGSLPGAAALDGWQVASAVSYSPRFIRGPVLGGWGKVPATGVTYTQTNKFLTFMRKAAAGEKIAVLLGEEEAAAIATSPFAADLEAVYKAPPLPFGVIATVGARITDARFKPLGEALPKIGDTPDGAKALEAVWKLKFMPLDAKALAEAKKSFLAVPK